ncbi:DUF4865 family protein [Marinomonas rhizomae]|uniref:Uncharacterized protein DUF4865 n=1 Tax=Marinomonas rhizomae TaxID=491948 RepID=A0A366JDR9_9GAMM|nr:DUF4865 family protein [Marinomonas rhizomae]RBP85133.1 uncharacterized protein DUF4865 [Marinomonas rhizomae]RNF76239.1 DUF4865 family protein [Marinomonas rhizomae]
MIVMQYSFTLPANYDMETIRNRITENGHKLNGFPQLIFKGYLYSIRNDNELDSPKENQYAPFYLWENDEGMISFLANQGYHQLEQDFGRPKICYGIPITYSKKASLKTAKYLKKEIIPISRDSKIADIIEQEKSSDIHTLTGTDNKLVASISSLNPEQWLLTRWTFWTSQTVDTKEITGVLSRDWFHIGYLAQ